MTRLANAVTLMTEIAGDLFHHFTIGIHCGKFTAALTGSGLERMYTPKVLRERRQLKLQLVRLRNRQKHCG